MKKWIKNKKRLVILVFLLVICIALFLKFNEENIKNIPGGKLFLYATYPVLKPLKLLENQIQEIALVLFETSRIEEENKLLKDEVAQLEIEKQILKEYLKSLEAQSKLISSYKDKNFRFIGAEILFLTSGKWSRSAIIDKGKSDDVFLNQPVVIDSGLVGIVKQVSKRTSTIQLIIDQNSYVGGKAKNTGDRGLVLGIGKTSELHFHLEIFSPEIKEGYEVVTSGVRNSFYPAGISIGVIKEFRQDRKGNKFAVLRPSVNFQKLSKVLLISSAD